MEMSNNLVHLATDCEMHHLRKVSSAGRSLRGLRAKSLKLEEKLVTDTASLECIKHERSVAQSDHKGLAAELACVEANLKARQARIQSLQADIAPLTQQLQELHEEEASLRDKFISDLQDQTSIIRKMHEEHSEALLEQVLEAKLREVQQRKEAKVIVALDKERQDEVNTGQEGQTIVHHKQPTEGSIRRDLVEKLAQTKKALETMATEIVGLEGAFAFYRSEVVRQTICPQCGSDNIEQMLDGMAQSAANGGQTLALT